MNVDLDKAKWKRIPLPLSHLCGFHATRGKDQELPRLCCGDEDSVGESLDSLKVYKTNNLAAYTPQYQHETRYQASSIC